MFRTLSRCFSEAKQISKENCWGGGESGRELIIRGMPVNQNRSGAPRRKSGYEQRLHSAITKGERAPLRHCDGMQISAAIRETCREVTAKIRGRGTMKLL